MSTPVALLVLLMSLGCLAAAMFEIWMALVAHPSRWIYGWLAWTPLAMLGIALMRPPGTNSLLEVAVTCVVLGPICYPLGRFFWWLRFELRFSDDQEAAKELERLRFHATDFGGPTRATTGVSAFRSQTSKESPAASPLTSLPSDARLARIVSPPQSAVARHAETVLLFAVGAAIITLSLGLQFSNELLDSGAPEAVADTLDIAGYPYARVKRDWGVSDCPRHNFAYDWKALGSQGRACVSRDDGEIQVKVDRVWAREEFGR